MDKENKRQFQIGDNEINKIHELNIFFHIMQKLISNHTDYYFKSAERAEYMIKNLPIITEVLKNAIQEKEKFMLTSKEVLILDKLLKLCVFDVVLYGGLFTINFSGGYSKNGEVKNSNLSIWVLEECIHSNFDVFIGRDPDWEKKIITEADLYYSQIHEFMIWGLRKEIASIK
jgi:hypothetical protein